VLGLTADSATNIDGFSPSDSAAVVGVDSYGKSGVAGRSIGGNGVAGISDSSNGIYGESSTGAAGYFKGNVHITGDSRVDGTIFVGTDIVLGGGDCAEEFDLSPTEDGEPGTVMVIDEGERLSACAEAYDQRVAGVIAGAGEYSPGLILDRRASQWKRCPIAILGKVCCKVDAAYGSIRVGDLLTTSPNPGHAMKASDRSRAFGATIGKALRSLSEGTGLIPIMVSTR
jgi:hypothetical protein